VCAYVPLVTWISVITWNIKLRQLGHYGKSHKIVMLQSYTLNHNILFIMYSKFLLIRIEMWKMKNSVRRWVHALKDIMDLGTRGIRARELSDCVEGTWRDWNHTRIYPRLAWAGFQLLREKEFAAVIFFFLFISTTCIIKFSIFFTCSFCCLFGLSLNSDNHQINPDYRGLTICIYI
jgi:hypothetical protein